MYDKILAMSEWVNNKTFGKGVSQILPLVISIERVQLPTVMDTVVPLGWSLPYFQMGACQYGPSAWNRFEMCL